MNHPLQTSQNRSKSYNEYYKYDVLQINEKLVEIIKIILMLLFIFVVTILSDPR